MATLTDDARAFPTEHAFRHKLHDGGRESMAHMLMFPELGIAGFIYPAVLSDGQAKVLATLIGPGIDGDIHEQVASQISPAANFDNLQLGPLHMAVGEPYQSVELAWMGERFQFRAKFEALHPPYAFSLHPAGNPPYFGNNRTEQHGRISGNLVVDGREMTANGFLIRDHSWGPRIWGLNQHYKWFHAVTNNCSVHFFEMESFGRRQLRGFLWRDGQMEHLATLECDFCYDEHMMQRSLQIHVVDQAGRVANISANAFADIQLEFDPMVYLNEAALRLDVDGEQGVGWCEFCWNRDYFNFARDYVGKYG